MGRQRYNKQAETETAATTHRCCHTAYCHAQTTKNTPILTLKPVPAKALTNQRRKRPTGTCHSWWKILI